MSGRSSSGIVKRSIAIHGHRTSISLEEPFFSALGVLARSRNVSLASLVAEVDGLRNQGSSLSSALRLYVLEAARRGALRAPEGSA